MSFRLPLVAVASLALTGPAFAARPNLTATAVVDPGEVAAGTPAVFTAQMCTDSSAGVTNAYMGAYVTTSYSIASQPRGGSCRAVRYTGYTYIYCMLSLRAGSCASLRVNVTPSAIGDYDLTALADGSNLIRETNETDNAAVVVLSAY